MFMAFYVKIKHDDTYSTLYGHCPAFHISVGQTVKPRQAIADCGSTGYSAGSHCYFEVIQNGVKVHFKETINRTRESWCY